MNNYDSIFRVVNELESHIYVSAHFRLRSKLGGKEWSPLSPHFTRRDDQEVLQLLYTIPPSTSSLRRLDFRLHESQVAAPNLDISQSCHLKTTGSFPQFQDFTSFLDSLIFKQIC